MVNLVIRIRRLLPSPAVVVACLALLPALGGVGYAAGPDTVRTTPPGQRDACVG
jgi:hypothetical protein